jgi:hypothetical protein
MNRCRSDGGKQPRVIRRSKGKYDVPKSKFAFFLKITPVRSKTRLELK